MSGQQNTSDPFDTFAARAAVALLFTLLIVFTPTDNWLGQLGTLNWFVLFRTDVLRLLGRSKGAKPGLRLVTAGSLQPAPAWRRLVREMPILLLIVLKLTTPGPWPGIAIIAWVTLSAVVAVVDRRHRPPHDYLAGTVKMHITGPSPVTIPASA